MKLKLKTIIMELNEIKKITPNALKLYDIVNACYAALKEREPKNSGDNLGISNLAGLLVGITRSSIDWREIGYNGEPDIIGESYLDTRNVYKTNGVQNTWAGKFGSLRVRFLPYIDANTKTSINMFCQGNFKLIEIADSYNFEAVTIATQAFYGCSSLMHLDQIFLSVTAMKSTFYGCYSLYGLKNADKWNLAGVTTMESCFYQCGALRQIACSGWRLDKCTNFYQTFSGCASLASLNCNSWFAENHENVTSFSNFLTNCSSLESSESAPISLNRFFSGKSGTTHPGCSANAMFQGCKNIECVDFTNAGTENVTNYANMFYGCSKLKKIVGALDMSRISSYNNVKDMFANCTVLQYVEIDNLSCGISIH